MTEFAEDLIIEDAAKLNTDNRIKSFSPGNNVKGDKVLYKKATTITQNTLKRPHSDTDENKKRPRMSPGEDVESMLLPNAPHNSPVAILNKLCQNLDYKVIGQSGPAHCAVFTVSVEVNGQNYVGRGSSKKSAKATAAVKALNAMHHPLPPTVNNYDFTLDDNLNISDSINGCVESENKNSIVPPVSKTNNTKEICTVIPKSPINVIHEKYPDAVFHCEIVEFGIDSCNVRYKVICEIGDQKFEGHGSSKKAAKLGAAKAALAALGDTIITVVAQPSIEVKPLFSSPFPQALADQVSKLVIDKFNEMMQSDPIHIRRKVLSGIVMTYGPNYKNVQIITVSSGTKCVSGDRLSTSGLAVNDCHAEVISRRCLQVYFYNCLKEIINSPDGYVNESNPFEPAVGGGYQLKDTYRFHLYISTAPCGDARIFSPHEEACLPPDRHPNRQARGQLRTKIESGEGTIPVKSSGGIQTWDGVLLGERLLTMSCSDKVCRWNVLGVQGSLLSNYLRPVYFQSIVLGSLLHPHHLYRAVCGRIIGSLKKLQPPFYLNRPMLAQSSSIEQRNSMRAPTFSVNWTKGQANAEVINAFTGKTEVGKPSRLCKHNMFKHWLELAPKLSPLPNSALANAEHKHLSIENNIGIMKDFDDIGYDIAKSKATLYQYSKQCLFEAFHEANLGKWLKKPIEQDQFHIVENDK